ncbi:TPA: hypothetical protein ACG50O_000780 [Streptococcus agalactiae]
MSKGYKVVDVGSNHEYDVTFGTCEVCMSYGNEVDNPYIVIEKPDGTKKRLIFTIGAGVITSNITLIM